jgi:hypothetical protein
MPTYFNPSTEVPNVKLPCVNYHLSGGTGNLGGLLGVDLLAVLVVSDSWWGSTVAATFTGSNTVVPVLALNFGLLRSPACSEMV